MKRKLIIGGWLGFFYFFSLSAFELSPPPVENYYDLSSWRKRDVFTVPAEGVVLTEDIFLQVDEVIIAGELVTNGHRLQIDAKVLVFEEGGQILAFNAPATSGPKGEMGPKGVGGGGNGSAPPQASKGEDGHANPGEILIYTHKVIGQAHIDGTGQSGGRGGEGGDGGPGGQGGPGRNAQASCGVLWWNKDHEALPGSRGGQGGPGGKGGDGGRGGAPVPVIFVTGEQPELIPVLISQGGKPGDPGKPGKPGAPGPGGPGGQPDSRPCGTWPVKWRAHVAGASQGPDGPKQTLTLGAGQRGEDPPSLDLNNRSLVSVKDLDPEGFQRGLILSHATRLESLRLELIEPWMQFHWSRSFFFLLLDSWQEIQSGGTLSSSSSTHGEFGSAFDWNENDFLSDLLARVHKDRLEKLIELWEEQFLVPLDIYRKVKEENQLQEDWLATAEKGAYVFVELLQLVLSGEEVEIELQKKMDEVKGFAEAQVFSSLDKALDACSRYIQVKQETLASLLVLTSHYAVPVCEADPDFRNIDVVDQPIRFFFEAPAVVPVSLQTYHQQIAAYSQPSKWNFMPRVWAQEFSVVPVKNEWPSISELKGHIPLKSQWFRPGVGLFMGFPQVVRRQGISEIGQGLYLLQQSLSELRGQ